MEHGAKQGMAHGMAKQAKHTAGKVLHDMHETM